MFSECIQVHHGAYIINMAFCFQGGGCGVGLGLGWGFGTAFGSQYHSSGVTFQGLDFGKKDLDGFALQKNHQDNRASR